MIARNVSVKDVASVSRFDGKYHNAEVNIYDTLIRNHDYCTLGECCVDIFTSSRTKRVYTNSDYGYPYFSNSDMLSNDPFFTCNYISRKYGFEETAVLRERMILAGRVGAIGQIAYVPKFWENFRTMGSDNIYRIIVKDNCYSGYIYAFLASHIGNLSFWKLATGGVQPYVTDSLIKTIPIPLFSKDFMCSVDSLMNDCNNLREYAFLEKRKAIDLLESFLTSGADVSYRRIHSHQIFNAHNRFDSQYQSEVQLRQNDNCNLNTFRIGSKASDIFVGNRGKRYYVKDGVPFLSSSDMMLFNPVRTASQVSLKTPQLSSMQVKFKDILISRSGTVGNCVFVSSYLEGVAVSEHALRLRIDDNKIAPEYIFTYLNTSQGQRKLKNAAYGSVIITLGEDFVNEIEVPMVPHDVYKDIVSLIDKSCAYLDRASQKESQAISLVEQKIANWSK